MKTTRSISSLSRCRLLFSLLPFLLLAAQSAAQRPRPVDSMLRLIPSAKTPGEQIELYALTGEYFYKFSPDSALYYTEKGIALAEKTDSLKMDSLFFASQSALLNNAAYIYHRKGKIYESIQLYEKALNRLLSRNDTAGTISLYLNLGTLYRDIREYDLALECLRKVQRYHDGDDHIAAGNCQIVIGTIYRARGEPDKALNNYFTAIGEFDKEYNPIGTARAYDQIGEVWFSRKDYPQAIYFYEKALPIFEKENDFKGISDVHSHMARTYLRDDNPAEAKKHALAAYDYALKTGYPQELADASSVLYQVYSREGNYKEALSMHEVYMKMSDSLDAEDAVKIAVQERIRSDFETRETLLKAEREKEKALNDEALKRQKLVSYVSLGGGILLLALLLLAVRSYRIKRRANLEISGQKQMIEVKNKEILDSINYARRIQKTLLAHEDFLRKNLPEHFVFFRPKDIVSGDFYWAASNSGSFYLAVCDSTGHGVPGAFMSLLNISFLNEAIAEKDIRDPAAVFDHVRQRLSGSISKEGAQDGMDGILFSFRQNNTRSIRYAGANNAPILIRNKSVVEFPADKMPVGISPGEESAFSAYEIEGQPGDLLIAYTDGYADQFGGPKGKKFKYRQLHELLCAVSDQKPEEIRRELEKRFESWKGNMEQTDDVLIIGIRL